MSRPDFSIITPSFNMLKYLKRCHASVADQRGVEVEHIVMDGGSKDGTKGWLTENLQATGFSEKDNGMYDAANKGFQKAQGSLLAYLNCDEQYLPNTLRSVADVFQKHSDVDIVFGNVLLVRPDGTLIAFRKIYQPYWPLIATSFLYVFSCAMFFRRSILENGFRFDTQFRDVGDLDFVVRLLRNGFKATCINQYLATYTITGNNMGLQKNAVEEGIKYFQRMPLGIRLMKYPLNIARILVKGISGAYFERPPLRYSIYPDQSLSTRRDFVANNPSFKWQA